VIVLNKLNQDKKLLMQQNKYRPIKAIINFLLVVWCVGFILPVIIPPLAPLLNIVYRNVCHQDLSKVIYAGNYHFLVCSRCTGIYIGLLVSSILIWIKPNIKLPLKYFIIASLPMLLDVIFYSTGIYNYFRSIALLTGLVFGSSGFFYIWNGIEKLLNELYLKKREIVE
jgi:uncharacterized membrane protein